MANAKLSFKPNERIENEKAGLVVMGYSYNGLALKSKKDGIYLVQTLGKDAVKGNSESEKAIMKLANGTIYLRVKVTTGGRCLFGYSIDGKSFNYLNDVFVAEVGRWIGARLGLYCTRSGVINDAGWVDVDWFRVEGIE